MPLRWLLFRLGFNSRQDCSIPKCMLLSIMSTLCEHCFMAHTLWCCKNIENTMCIPLSLVPRTVCLFPPKAFFSTISCIQVNLLLARVYLCVSYRQSQDIHILMIYAVYKFRHPICFLLAKWLPYIHHSYLKCLWKSVSQSIYRVPKKAFHINQYAINQ